MTAKKKPSHIHPEPKELGPEPVDIEGKEPVLVRDWDKESLEWAILSGQRDIMEHEVEYLLKTPYWQTTGREFEHKFKRIPQDIADQTLAKCRLDNIPVLYYQLVDAGPLSENDKP
jgi:hypothetical protein